MTDTTHPLPLSPPRRSTTFARLKQLLKGEPVTPAAEAVATQIVEDRGMLAVVQEGYGEPEDVLSLRLVERPTMTDDDVLVRLHATSVNTPDWITVTGIPKVLRLRFGLSSPPTPIRGSDIAGVVVAVGANVTDLRPGDEVFGSGWSEHLATVGTYCELTIAPASQLLRKPANVSFEQAAASVMSGITALIGMRQVAEVAPGDKVLVNGASGGVGTFAVQIAKALGAEVTGVCSTRNVELVRSLGADHVIDYMQEDFTKGEPTYDVILDNVMNRPPSQVVRRLRPGGVFVPNSVGNSGGFFAGLWRIAGASMLGLSSRRHVRTITCDVNRPNLEALATMLEEGDIASVIDAVYPLEEAAKAVSRQLSHRARGNVVIRI